MSKIVHIGQATDSTFSFSPVQLLQTVIEEIERGDILANRVLILLLDDAKENDYTVSCRMAQLRHSDCVSLMQYATFMLLSAMYEGESK